MRPQSQSWIGYEEDLFAFGIVVTIAQPGWAVPLQHAIEWRITKPYGLDFFFAQMPRAICDREAAFGRPVNQMRRRAEIRGEFGMPLDRLPHGARSTIPEAANLRIEQRILAELPYTGREDNEFASVR